MSWEGIVKVQRPIFTNDSYKTLYVYDKFRQHQQMMPSTTPEMMKLFPNDELKTFWNVRWNGSSKPEFLSIAPDQDW